MKKSRLAFCAFMFGLSAAAFAQRSDVASPQTPQTQSPAERSDRTANGNSAAPKGDDSNAQNGTGTGTGSSGASGGAGTSMSGGGTEGSVPADAPSTTSDRAISRSWDGVGSTGGGTGTGTSSGTSADPVSPDRSRERPGRER